MGDLQFISKQLPGQKREYEQREEEQSEHVEDIGQGFAHISHGPTQLFALVEVYVDQNSHKSCEAMLEF